MEQEIKARLERAISEKVFPGAVVGIVRKDGTRSILPAGRFTYEEGSPSVEDETVYDVASITKAVPVALLALKYIEEGKLGLDEQVIKYVPEISIESRETALIRHLLTYTYVLEKSADPNFSYENYKAKDVFEFLYTRPFAFPPGTQYQYSNTPANILALILERISGKKLHVLAKELILVPLQMEHSTFKSADKKLIPPTELTSWRGEIRGEVHDETAFILEGEGFDPGCAGLFSSAGDLLNVCETLLNDGIFKGAKIFEADTVALMKTNALADIDKFSGIGWELNEPRFMGKYTKPDTFGKTGFTGTSCVIDPQTGIAFVILSNRTYPERSSPNGINELRRDISDIVLRT